MKKKSLIIATIILLIDQVLKILINNIKIFHFEKSK